MDIPHWNTGNNILRKNIQDIKSKLTITNIIVKTQFMAALLVVKCREMGNEAYMETSLLQLLMDIASPAVYEIIYEALGINVMHGLTFWCRNYFLNFSTPCI